MDDSSRSKALTLLDLILRGLIDQILPSYDPRSGYEYCSSLEELGVTSCDETMGLIRELVGRGVLRRELHDRVASCSKCGSEVFLVRARCPYCGSLRFYRSVVIEHLTCGYVGLEAEFLTPQGILCPKCRRGLRGLGVDSIRVADVYRCEECGEVFSVPSATHECLKCGYENREVELKPKDIYRYVLVPESVRREEPILRLCDAIRSKSAGRYDILPHAKVRGASGVEFEFDIVVRDPLSGSTLAVIDFVESLDEERLLASFAKARGVSAGEVIIVHRGEVDGAVSSAASGLGVRLLRLGSIEQVAEDTLRYLRGRE